MNETEYIAYFEGLARKHSAIRHSDKDRRFYVVHNDNMAEVTKNIRSMEFPAMLIDQYYDSLDRSMDNFRKMVNGGVSVLVRCTVNNPEDRRRAHDEARAIALSIINRMYRDSRTVDSILYNRRVIVSTQFDGEPIAPVGENAVGWAYPFEWTMPTTVAVDPADWDDL